MGNFSPLKIAPGIVKTDSPYSLRGRWIDSDKVRFHRGQPEKWAGYESFAGPVIGIPRAAIAWDDFDLHRWLAVGTHSKLEIINNEGVITDITPLRAGGTLGNDPFSMTNTSAMVTVTHTAHGLLAGDTVIDYSGATAAGGITINGSYLVNSVVDADHYTIIHSSPATSTATGGGAAVLYQYEITPGSPNVVQGVGFGTGRWGRGTWGTPRTVTSVTRYPRMWSFATFGENLYALPSGQQIYTWDPDTPTVRAVVLANSPSGNFMFKSNERLPILLGTRNNPMELGWPDANDHTVWTPSSLNIALYRELPFGQRLIAGTNRKNFSNLVWSDTTCYTMEYTGAKNSIYTTLPAGHKCGLIGPTAFAINGDGDAFWMSTFTFFMFSGGGIVEIPNVSDIRDWLFKRLNQQQNWKCNCYYSSKRMEVRWHYILDGEFEPAYYVAVSLEDFSWTNGTYQRNAVVEQSGINPKVYGIDKEGYVYLEETGVDADGAPMPAFIESAPIDQNDGNSLVDMQGYIPDFQRQAGSIELTLTSWDKPMETNPVEIQEFTIEQGKGIEDMNMSGRQVSLRLETVELGGDFRLGQHRVEVANESQALRR